MKFSIVPAFTGRLRSVVLLCGILLLSVQARSAAAEEQTAAIRKEPATVAVKPGRHVTIAALGSRPLAVPADTAPQAIVNRMIGHWKGRLAQVLPDKPDLIVLPEVCDRPSGLSQDKVLEYYGVRKDQVRDFFASVAKDNRCYIVYSAKRAAADGTWRNSSVLLDRNGAVAATYDKNYPTIGEIDGAILPGPEICVADCDFGRVGFAICFDLNFDELRLRYAKAKPDLMIFSSVYHGGLMQAYWAYSCRCHFVGAVSGLPSEIYNPLGERIASSTNYFDYTVATVNLDTCLAHLDYNWGRLRSLKEKYGPRVTITDPGHLGSVLISSNTDGLTAKALAREFDIELLDDYFDRATDYRNKHFNPK
ncbi:MAG: carbon-nitrogen hydrolase family protein [Phycisphaerae bacterium]|nr:carbon-nitrogen hydrolase family protein [Phycisphaerae bacterium]